MNLLTAWLKNKRQVGGVLPSNNKTQVQNIAIIVPTVDLFGSLNLWEHLSLDDKYWKYLINVIVNAPTPPPGPSTSPITERAQPPSTPSPPRPSQTPLTSPPQRQSTISSPIPLLWVAPTPPRYQTLRYAT